MGVPTLSRPSTRRISREYSGPETRSHSKAAKACGGDINGYRAKGDGEANAHLQQALEQSVTQRRTSSQGALSTLQNENGATRTTELVPNTGNLPARMSTVWPCDAEIASHSVTWRIASPKTETTSSDERRARWFRRQLRRETALVKESRDHTAEKGLREGTKRSRRSDVLGEKRCSPPEVGRVMANGKPARKRRRGVSDAGAAGAAGAPGDTARNQPNSRPPPVSSTATSEVKVKSTVDDKGADERKSAPVMHWWRNQRLSHRPNYKMAGAGSSTPSGDTESFPKFLATPTTVPAQHSPLAIHCGKQGFASKREGESDDEDSAWTEGQVRSLRSAHLGTDPSAKHFWDVVASRVDGKSRGECQRKWFREFASTGPPRKRRATRKLSEQAVSSSSCTGSSPGNRRKLVGAAVDGATSRGYRADDLFQATPMRGVARFSMKTERVFGSNTPQSPAGAVGREDGHVLGGVTDERQAMKKHRATRTYVQAVSRRMVQVAGMSHERHNDRSGVQKKLAKSSSSLSSRSGRQFHSVATSQRGSVKASLSASGTVSVTYKGASDEASEGDASDRGSCSESEA